MYCQLTRRDRHPRRPLQNPHKSALVSKHLPLSKRPQPPMHRLLLYVVLRVLAKLITTIYQMALSIPLQRCDNVLKEVKPFCRSTEPVTAGPLLGEPLLIPNSLPSVIAATIRPSTGWMRTKRSTAPARSTPVISALKPWQPELCQSELWQIGTTFIDLCPF